MASTSAPPAKPKPQASKTWTPPDELIAFPPTNPYPSYEPILPPPAVGALPQLPFGARPQSSLPKALQSTHVLSTHIISAAWPRTPGELFDPAKHEPPAQETKDQRKARVNREFRTMQTKKRAAERRERDLPDRNEVLYNVMNRYRRKGPWVEDGLTLVVTHAVGFPKEIWEPTYARLIQQTEADAGVKVNEIWGFEATNHGDSALVNEGKLGFIYPWAEASRDLVNFLLYYLPANPAANAELPLHLERISDTIAQTRRRFGFVGERTLVGVGHSAGMTSMMLSAIWEPKLYHSLVAIEPIIMHPNANNNAIFNSWVTGAIARRFRWPSWEEARAGLKKSFGYWDPEVLETYVQYALTEDKKVGGVMLKTPIIQEAMWFSERQNGVHAFEQLADLNPDIELRMIYSGRSPEATGGEVSTRHTAHRRTANTSNVRISVSHLMPQESPKKLSAALVEWLQGKYSPRSSLGGSSEVSSATPARL